MSRGALTEWIPFRTFRAEIQIRTLLQHAWDVISRRYDYKTEADIPKEVRRRLFRLSALFELGDEQLEQFGIEAGGILETYQASLQKGSLRIEINVDSLRAYVETSAEVKYWNDFLRTDPEIGHRVSVDDWGDLSRDVRLAKFFGLTHIQDIDSVLKAARGWGEVFFKRFYLDKVTMHGNAPQGVSTVVNGTIGYLILASNADKLDANTLSLRFGYGDPRYAQRILELALESKKVAKC